MRVKDTETISKTKRIILEVSEELFAEKGFDKTGVNEIAENAGIAKSVIYHHFKNKSDILQVLIKNLSSELIGLKHSIMEKRPEQSEDTAKAIFEELLTFWETHRRIATIIMTESLKNSIEVPLLTLWDNSISKPMDSFNKNTNMTIDEIQQIIEGTFFFMFLPVYSFAILEGKWCQHYNIDSQKARQIFLNSMTRTFKNRIW
jgi:AcrR family transcriptional regulator